MSALVNGTSDGGSRGGSSKTGVSSSDMTEPVETTIGYDYLAIFLSARGV